MSQKRATLFVCVFALSSSLAYAASEDRSPMETAPDNTAVNERDRAGNTMTADRQSEGTRSDVEITREIRQMIVKDDAFSTSAKNVKIITKNGIVSLRGPVLSVAEKSKIASLARNVAGVSSVKNSLEVKKQ